MPSLFTGKWRPKPTPYSRNHIPTPVQGIRNSLVSTERQGQGKRRWVQIYDAVGHVKSCERFYGFF